MIYSLGEDHVQYDKSVYLAPGCHVMGKVILEKDVSIWFNVVIRGDCDQIIIKQGSNIQDGCILHTDDGYPLQIGEGVTVGHKVMLHGCIVGDNSLIGINSVVLNGAQIGKNCVVGANSLITENMRVPDNSLVMGSPAKVVKVLSTDQIELLTKSAEHYVNNAQIFAEKLKPID